MANRTQIVCLCEGNKGKSIDEVFIYKLIRTLEPSWLRLGGGSNMLRLVPCGGRTAVIEKMPEELKNCLNAGGQTTLMVWADCDDDCDNGAALKDAFWKVAEPQKITREQFAQVVFVFPKDRLENWIEFLQNGSTDESIEGRRVRHNRDVADAAKKLAETCKTQTPMVGLPPSLQWSCKNWQALNERMKS